MACLEPVTVSCTLQIQIHSAGGIHELFAFVCNFLPDMFSKCLGMSPYLLVYIYHFTELIIFYVWQSSLWFSHSTVRLLHRALVAFMFPGPLFSCGVQAVPKVVGACTAHILM